MSEIDRIYGMLKCLDALWLRSQPPSGPTDSIS